MQALRSSRTLRAWHSRVSASRSLRSSGASGAGWALRAWDYRIGAWVTLRALRADAGRALYAFRQEDRNLVRGGQLVCVGRRLCQQVLCDRLEDVAPAWVLKQHHNLGNRVQSFRLEGFEKVSHG